MSWTYGKGHTLTFVKPYVAYWLEREIAEWVHPMKDRSNDPSHQSTRSYHGATFHVGCLSILCSTNIFRRFFPITSVSQNVETKGNNKNVLFLNLNDKIIEQEMNKMAIHTHVIFRPHNAMFFLLNNYVFPDW